MSAHATFPIGRRFADVRSTPRRVPVLGRRGNSGRLHPFGEGYSAVGTELGSREEGAEGARDEYSRPSV